MAPEAASTLESAWLLNRPAGDVVLENKLYYQNFGVEIDGRAAPDHLLTQLEFLAWLDHCEAAGNADLESLKRARMEFLERHLSHSQDVTCARLCAGRWYVTIDQFVPWQGRCSVARLAMTKPWNSV